MGRIIESDGLRWVSPVLLGWVLAAWPAVASGQEGAPSPLAVPLRVIPPSPGVSQDLFERLGKMEERLDWVTKQNEGLLRENKVLAEKVGTAFRTTSNPGPQDATSPLFGTAPTGGTAAPSGDAGSGLFSPADPGAVS